MIFQQRKESEIISKLSKDDIDYFYSNGYLKVSNFVSQVEINTIKNTIFKLYDRFDRLPKNLARDLEEQNKVRKNPEVERCLWLAPSLNNTKYVKSITAIAKQLLGNDASLCYDHSIMKMPNSNAPTRWHQDEAYELAANKDVNLSARPRLSFWLPLQDVNKQMGCMQFLPSPFLNTSLQLHYPIVPGGHVLTTDMSNLDLSTVDICELQLGGFTIHGGRTLHYAAGNCTDNYRFAWIVSFMSNSKPYYNWLTHLKNYIS